MGMVAHATLLAAGTCAVFEELALADVLAMDTQAKPYVLRIEKFLYSKTNPAVIIAGASWVIKPALERDRAFKKLSLFSEMD